MKKPLGIRCVFVLSVICGLLLMLSACGKPLSSSDTSGEAVSGVGAVVSGSAASGNAINTVSGTAVSGVSTDAVSGPGAGSPPGVDEQIDMLVDMVNLWCDEAEYDEPSDNPESMEGLNDGKYCVTDMDEDGYLEIVQWIDGETLLCQELQPQADGYVFVDVDMAAEDEKTKEWVDIFQKDVFCESGEEVAAIRIRMRPDPEWLRKRLRISYDERR